jgi:very-short-patch-repair endonuclease
MSRRSRTADQIIAELATRAHGVVTRIELLAAGISDDQIRQRLKRDSTVWRGIPVTTPARTLVDLAAVLSEEELARVFHTAHVRFRTQPGDVEEVLARRPSTKGAAPLRRVVQGDSALLLSRMEKRFRVLLKRHRLPLPVTNGHIDARYIDCRWPTHRLTVELDGYRFHATRHAWEQDHRREREAYARGDQFRRYTWHDVFEDSRAMLRELRELLLGQGVLL